MDRETRITVDGARIFVRERGTGPPVLLLHGNPDSADLWDGVLSVLAPRHRCLAPDLPGFARSEIPAGFDFRLPAMAAFVDRLLAELDVEGPVDLAVHDFGGPYGLAWAVEHPAKVGRIAVLSALFSSRLRWHFWARVWRTPVLGELAMALMNRRLFAFELRRGSRRLPRGHVERAWARVTPAAKAMVLELYRATDPESFRGWEERLAALAAERPVKVLWGRRDPYLDPALARTFGTDDVEIFDDAGHWLPVEEPAAVAERLVAFFGREKELVPEEGVEPTRP